jgi:hypothetical protein
MDGLSDTDRPTKLRSQTGRVIYDFYRSVIMNAIIIILYRNAKRVTTYVDINILQLSRLHAENGPSHYLASLLPPRRTTLDMLRTLDAGCSRTRATAS